MATMVTSVAGARRVELTWLWTLAEQLALVDDVVRDGSDRLRTTAYAD